MSNLPPPNKELAPSYRHVALVYDLFASAYSLGAIDRAKAYHQQLIKPGDRVLYIGAGRGKEIVEVCKHGTEVTCVEPCPAMASKLHARLSNVADGFIVAPKPIQSVPAEPAYDLVVAHFFLNVFDAEKMPAVLEHLCGFIKPGGQIVIADFFPDQSRESNINRFVRKAYYRPVNLAGYLLKICALHPIYDYTSLLAKQGLIAEPWQSFRALPGLAPLYGVVSARRP
jgi:demethylmenaquinone methyltransferase/2-methoxy-6-polyprenyl-1,4-benzoquinol methylase